MFSLSKFLSSVQNSKKKVDSPEKLASVRGANSGFLINGKIPSKYNASCPRVILLRSKGIEKPVDLTSYMTFEVGHLWEEFFELGAKEAFDKPVKEWKTYKDDEEISEVLPSGSRFSGRPDHVITFEDGTRAVVETKSVSSVSSAKELLSGKYKSEYLAQLVAYMDVLKINQGYLAFGIFCWGYGIKPDILVIDVQIDSAGDVLVNGSYTEYQVEHSRLHRELAGWVIDTNTVVDSRLVTESACKYCPFAKVCDKFDEHKINGTEFINLARAEVEGE